MDDKDVVIDEDEALRQFLPNGFGKQARGANVAAQIDRKKRSDPKVNTRLESKQSKSDGSEGEDSSKDDQDDENSDSDSSDDDEFPTSHELVLKTHERPITTITVDPSGSRMITGSVDCTIKLHDFASMTPSTLRAFKSIDPTASKTSASSETHPVYHVEFNPISPGQVLVISATPKAKILNRDGDTLVEFNKGDMYLRDMHNTKGHVSEITTGTWHPTDKNFCVTAGTDSTLRIWDVNMKRCQKDVIVHKSRVAGSAGRTRMTAVGWGAQTQGGPNILVAAALDGSLVMWSGEGPYHRPAAEIRDAHKKDTWTSGLAISGDGRTVVTRGGDNTIKLWDTRKFKQPVSSIEHISTSDQYTTSNIVFSPNSSSILTGSQSGELHILNPATLKPELVTAVTPGSALITVQWHEKLNQILTGSANAETHILYNPKTSTRGAAMIMSKAPKRRHIDDDPSLTTDISQGISGDSVVNPNGLLSTNQESASYAARHPTVGMTASGKSRDPRRPHIPMTTPFAKSQPDEQHIRNNIPLSSMRDEDPREALLKYAEKAEKEPMFTNAWKHTQPKTLYAELSDEEDEEAPDKKKVKR
jgi:WD40 repeat protein